MKKPVEYVNNKTLYTEMLKYRNAVRDAAEHGKEKPQISNYIGECILMIARRLSSKPNFSGYSYRDEMISDGIENSIQYGVDKFDPDKYTNPFAYFTQIIKWAFVRRIQKERKQQYIKNKNMQQHNLNQQLIDNTYIGVNTDFDAFIIDFEKSMSAKKAKNQKAKVSALDVFCEDEDE